MLFMTTSLLNIYISIYIYINIKTSMMWPSQNFLLYNRNIIKVKVTEWKNNLRKYVNPPPPWGYIQHVQIITI